MYNSTRKSFVCLLALMFASFLGSMMSAEKRTNAFGNLLTMKAEIKPRGVGHDGLMVMAFVFPIIATKLQVMNVFYDPDPYKEEGTLHLGGENISMFEAIRRTRHRVNPQLDISADGVWSHMEWDNLLHYNIIKNATRKVVNGTPVSSLAAIQTPLEWSQGGLGYYDHRDFITRRRQGQLAAKYGVDGLIYYSYTQRPHHNAVVDARVRDGEPAGPFAVMNVDEDKLGTARLFLYGKWLRSVVSNRDYIHVNERPVVFLYMVRRILADDDDFVTAESLRRALTMIEEEAGQKFYWVGTSSEYVFYSIPPERLPSIFQELDAWINFSPHDDSCMRAVNSPPQYAKVFYESFLSGWNSAPRGLAWFDSRHKGQWGNLGNSDSFKALKEFDGMCTPPNSPSRFYDILREGLHRLRCSRPPNETGQLSNGKQWKLATVFAWNEWGEQAVLEPSVLYGFSLLESLLRARTDAAVQPCLK